MEDSLTSWASSKAAKVPSSTGKDHANDGETEVVDATLINAPRLCWEEE